MLNKFKHHSRFIHWMPIDFTLFAIASFVSITIVNGFSTPVLVLVVSTVISVVVHLTVFAIMKIYDSIWRYTGIYELKRIWLACLWSLIPSTVLALVFLPRLIIVVILSFFINAVLVPSSRLLFQHLLKRGFFSRKYTIPLDERNRNVLIVGAGEAGVALSEELKKTGRLGMRVVAFLDDDPTKLGRSIKGIKVVGTCAQAASVVKDYEIHEIIIAMPSAAPERKREIMNTCAGLGCTLQTLPGLYELVDGTVSIQQVRDVKIDDLLGRDEVVFDSRVNTVYRDKVIMITGGGGSIGSEICRQLMPLNPRKVILLDVYENGAYELEMEMKRRPGACPVEVAIVSVCDRPSLRKIFMRYKPNIVFHAAAHKHVPFMESWPHEAVANNVFGTLNTAEIAVECGVQRFIMVSTDKAVRPTNVMGATKRICELVVQASNGRDGAEFAAVRFGNVLGSNGSVIPLFARQIREGGPVTVTHPEIIRYFMTIPEASKLVIEAGGIAKGGEVFILDMGEPVKIKDLAERMITLSGLRPGQDIKIEYTGLRPGEKLYEELLLDGEGIVGTLHEKIFVARQTIVSREVLEKQLDTLRRSLQGDDVAVKAAIRELVPEYAPEGQGRA